MLEVAVGHSASGIVIIVRIDIITVILVGARSLSIQYNITNRSFDKIND